MAVVAVHSIVPQKEELPIGDDDVYLVVGIDFFLDIGLVQFCTVSIYVEEGIVQVVLDLDVVPGETDDAFDVKFVRIRRLPPRFDEDDDVTVVYVLRLEKDHLVLVVEGVFHRLTFYGEDDQKGPREPKSPARDQQADEEDDDDRSDSLFFVFHLI